MVVFDPRGEVSYRFVHLRGAQQTNAEPSVLDAAVRRALSVSRD